MRSFTLEIPTKYVFGPGSFDRAGREIKAFSRRVLLVCSGGSVVRNGFLDKLEEQLRDEDVQVYVYDKVQPNPLVSQVDEGGRLARELKVDTVVALGGGSVMDAAKGMAVVAENEGSIWDYVSVNKTVKRSLPVITIPTLSATGSESNAFGVVTNDATKEKVGFICRGAVPVLAVIDPGLTLTVPAEYLKDAAVDVIAHSIEAYISSKDHAPMNDNLSLALIRTVVETAPAMLQHPEDIELRSAFAWTSTLALNGLNDAGREGPYTLHAMEHPMSGLFDISHGRGLSVLIPPYLQYFQDERADKIIKLGKFVFNMQEPSPEAVLAEFRKWLRGIDRDIKMADVGISADDIPALLEQLFQLSSNRFGKISGPRQLDREEVDKIYRACV